MRTDQIFQEEIFRKFRRLSRKLRYAPYSHGFKAHKKFLPESAFLVPTKGGLVQWPYLFRIEHTCQYKQII